MTTKNTPNSSEHYVSHQVDGVPTGPKSAFITNLPFHFRAEGGGMGALLESTNGLLIPIREMPNMSWRGWAPAGASASVPSLLEVEVRFLVGGVRCRRHRGSQLSPRTLRFTGRVMAHPATMSQPSTNIPGSGIADTSRMGRKDDGLSLGIAAGVSADSKLLLTRSRCRSHFGATIDSLTI